jgi:zinc transporter ZupT
VSGGVMIFLSFVEMFIPAWNLDELIWGVDAKYPALLFLTVGLGIGFIFDVILPEEKNVHEHIFNGTIVEQQNNDTETTESRPMQGEKYEPQKYRYLRMHRGRKKRNRECNQMYCIDEAKFMKLGILTVLALFLHNLPEGLATFSSSLLDPKLGVQIAVATGMHNIPEGISVAIPIYIATRNKRKAVLYAFASGLAEPVGGLIAYGILYPFLSGPTGTLVLNLMLACTAGIMIYITVDVLIPTAKLIEYKHTTIIGFTLGMVVIGITIILIEIGSA